MFCIILDTDFYSSCPFRPLIRHVSWAADACCWWRWRFSRTRQQEAEIPPWKFGRRTVNPTVVVFVIRWTIRRLIPLRCRPANNGGASKGRRRRNQDPPSLFLLRLRKWERESQLDCDRPVIQLHAGYEAVKVLLKVTANHSCSVWHDVWLAHGFRS